MQVQHSRRRFLGSTLVAGAVAVACPEDIEGAVLDQRTRLEGPEDRALSPCTGYTRTHWIEIAERLLAGVLPHLEPDTGLPRMVPPGGDEAHFSLYNGDPHVARMQAMERIMILAVIYTAATGRDSVPGYTGSITAPFRRAIARISSPDDPLYCRRDGPAAYMGSETALAILASPEYFWEPFTAQQRKNVLAFLHDLTTLPSYDNNHLLFHMVPIPVLEAHGVSVDIEHRNEMLARLLGWYVGDGWFIDGSNGGFDWYNAWGFHLYLNLLCKYEDQVNAEFGDRIREATRRFFDAYPYFFGRDGAPVAWGRSLAYRFAGLAPLGWAWLNDACGLGPGQARRIASGCLRYFWEHNCLEPDGVLPLGYWGANAAVAENYLTHGTCYFAAQGLSCLLIPQDDPFWTAPEAPMPADHEDSVRVLNGPQMVVRTRARDGEARLFSVGQSFGHGGHDDRWQRGAKYFQHAYSSALGFCLGGEGGTEHGAGRTGFSLDGSRWAYRDQPQAIRLEADHVASVYEMDFASLSAGEASSAPQEFGQITTHALIGKQGEVHVFWHNGARPVFLHVGGYGVCVAHGEEARIDGIDTNVNIDGTDTYSVFNMLDGPPGVVDVEELEPRAGWLHTHLFGGKGIFAYWRSRSPVAPGVPVVVHVDGGRGTHPDTPEIEVERQHALTVVRFEGKTHRIQIPS